MSKCEQLSYRNLVKQSKEHGDKKTTNEARTLNWFIIVTLSLTQTHTHNTQTKCIPFYL